MSTNVFLMLVKTSVLVGSKAWEARLSGFSSGRPSVYGTGTPSGIG